MGVTAFTFTKIVVADLDRAVPFYRDAIGLTLLNRITAPDGEYAQEEAIMGVEGKKDGPMLLLVRYLNKPAPPSGSAWTGLVVENLPAVLGAVEQAGGTVIVPIHDVPKFELTIAVVTDPEGHLIELMTPLMPR